MRAAYLPRRFGGFLLVGMILALLGQLPWLGAVSTAEAQVVDRIRVEGNQRVDDETIRAYLQIQPGRRFSQEDLNESLRALFATGLFADVGIDQVGNALVVTVVENPVINQIAFEGNRAFNDEMLGQTIQSRPRGVFTPATVQNDVRRILELYSRQGRFQAAVTPQVIELPQNRVNLVFEVREGPRTHVARINFIGNRAFSDGRLRNAIETREAGLLSFLRAGATYEPDRLAADEERLRRYYLNRGYADFRIVSTVADLDRERNAFFITFTLDEGQRYRFGAIEVDSIVPGIDPEALRRLAVTRPGSVFSAREVEETLEAITIELAQSGYAFAQVRPRIDRDPDNLVIDVTYVVDEGPRAYVERINIRGNTRTRDYVIRREFDIAEGDAYNRVLIDRAERRLRNLDFFETVRVTGEPGTAPDRVIVTVEVVEKATGELSFGAGWANTDGFIGDVSLVERNFLGRGYHVHAGFTGGRRTRQFEFAFTDPFFLGRRISGGFNVFRRTFDQDAFRPYDYEETGGGLTLGFPITEEFTVQVGYTFVLLSLTIPGFAPTAVCPPPDGPMVSLAVCQAVGRINVSSLSYSMIYDTLDNRTDPRDGIFARFTQQLAGVGGNNNFLRSTATATGYRELLPDHDVVGLVRLQGGHITGWGGDDVRLVDSFFKGGETVRGFDTRGFGPREVVTFFDDAGNVIGTDRVAVGGNMFIAGTAEAQFPFPVLPRELGLRGAVFADAGALWDTDAVNIPGVVIIGNDFAVRSSVGASILWASPLGPLRADFAYVLTKEPFDREQFFRIGGGTRF
jgi:outer membrane protein insertion porin family